MKEYAAGGGAARHYQIQYQYCFSVDAKAPENANSK
jgi:hypothetical protein